MLSGLFVRPKDNNVNKSKDTQEETEAKKEKRITKYTAAALACIMILFAVISFFNGDPAFVISDGVVYVLVLVLALLVWDSVETLSLGSIVSLTKTVKDKEKEVNNLSSENRELRNQIITAMQNSQNTNLHMFFGGDGARVEPVTQDDSKRKKRELESYETAKVIGVGSDGHSFIPRHRKLFAYVDMLAIEKFALKNSIPVCDLQNEVHFSEKFIERDPILIQNVVFDAYVNRPLGELFIEACIPTMPSMFEDRLYYKISKVQQYSIANKVTAKVVLVVPKIDQKVLDTENDQRLSRIRPDRFISRIKDKFAPAIKNSLLEIAEIEITYEEIQELKKKAESRSE